MILSNTCQFIFTGAVGSDGNKDKTTKTTRKDKRSSSSLVSQEMLNAGTLGGMFGSVSSTKFLTSVQDDKRAVEEDIYKNFDFPFENLILEGGGNKGMAYVGALQVKPSFHSLLSKVG